ncbi:MAG TPA: EpsG family protein [Candidatus Merdenecus merdavium]|nr:EpsG family protein [Candidatus Merdenecus merdavium]
MIFIFSGMLIISAAKVYQQAQSNFLYGGIGIFLIITSIFLDKSLLPDYEQYVSNFQITDFGFGLEPSFTLISCIVKYVFDNDVFWGFVIYIVLGILIKLIAIKQLTNLLLLSLALYVSSYWLYHELIQIRVGVAGAFFLLSIKPLYERNLKKFLLYSCVAILFHFSAVMILPLWFIRDRLNGMIIYVLLIPLSMLMYIFNLDLISILRMLPIPIISDKVEGYLLIAQIGDVNRKIITASEYNPFVTWYILKALIGIYLWLNVKRMRQFNCYAIILLKIYTIGISLLWLLPSVPVIATRSSEFLSLVQIVLIPLFISTVKQKRLGIVMLYIFGLIWIFWNVNSFLLVLL